MEANPKPVESAKPEPVDLAKVRQTLGLPETASEAETVGALLEVVAVLQAKYDTLLGDNAELEKSVANRAHYRCSSTGQRCRSLRRSNAWCAGHSRFLANARPDGDFR